VAVQVRSGHCKGCAGKVGSGAKGKMVNVPMADGEIERMANAMNENIIRLN
jgi:hypothetical protein